MGNVHSAVPVLGIRSTVPAPSRMSMFQFTFSLTPNSDLKCLDDVSIKFGLTAKTRKVNEGYGWGELVLARGLAVFK